MAKKKKVINLSSQDITYKANEDLIKIIAFNPNVMDVEVSIIMEDKSKKITKLPYAQLPKEIKKLLNDYKRKS